MFSSHAKQFSFLRRAIGAQCLGWCHLGDALDLFQIWGVSFCREHSAKECHGLLLYGTLLAVEHESFFLGHIEQVDDVCVVVSVILSVDEHIIMYGQYARALGHNVIHPHLEDVPGTFSVQRAHVGICTF